MLSRYVVSQVKHNSCFLVGLALGLWVSLSVIPLDEEPAAEACAAALAADAALDDFQPQRDERPLGAAAAPPAGRSVQRPRYYSTELGMRGSVLTAVLSSEEALRSHIAALNRTGARLQPALKFFITARGVSAPGLANVVGFTDTREMLKPFHALKYLADNYLEEYDFFFLVSDAAYVNARRLAELAGGLSVSRDVYMGAPADGGPYCSLDAGMLLSNSVLRGVQAALEWCVRNSYSPHHHENIGRCVLRAHRRPCAEAAQGRRYHAAELDGEGPLEPRLAEAVTVHPVRGARALFSLHAFVARERLVLARRARLRTRAQLWRTSARHPAGFRNATWPGGLRADPGLAPPLPATRFDHLRWVAFNATHAFFPDDRREVALVAGAMREALDLVVGDVRAWALGRWPEAGEAEVVEGAWRWEPATALRYRLLLRLRPRGPAPRLHQLRLVEAVRALGAARMAPVRYVTESGRVSLVLPLRVRTDELRAARAFLRLYEAVCLDQDKNTALIVVMVAWDEEPGAAALEAAEAFRAAAEALREARPEASLLVVDAPRPAPQRVDVGALPEADALALSARAALAALEGVAARDALLLLMVPHAQYNQDFLNRVRMNTIAGEQWFAASAFGRFALYDHPRFVTPQGAKPTTNTGRFNVRHHLVFSVYRSDYEAALAQWRGGSGSSPAEVLGGAPLRCLLAPEPALVLEPRGAPCGPGPSDVSHEAACLARLARDGFSSLELGARHSLAQLLLEAQADAQP